MPPVSTTDSQRSVRAPVPQGLRKKLEAILERNGVLHKVSEVQMDDAGGKNDGLSSLTDGVTVIFQDPSVAPLHLFVKTETTNPSHLEFLTLTRQFEKESTFLVNYIPALGKFCAEKGQEDLLKIYPRCYHGDKSMIVLENLVPRGYNILDKIEQHDLEAASLAVTALAKHHALSSAFIQSVGGQAAFFKKFSVFQFDAFKDTNAIRSVIEPIRENDAVMCIKILEKSSVKGQANAIAFLREHAGKLWDTMENALKIDCQADRLLVLNHGDFWNNNMMFRKNEGKLDGPILIDFQAVRYDSPATDLSYFLYFSVKPEVRREHLKDLLKVYLDVLNEASDKLGFPANLSYDELFSDFQRKYKFAYWFCGGMFSAQLVQTMLKDFDASKVEVGEMSTFFAKLQEKWIEENPEAREEEAKIIVNSIAEYKALSIKKDP